MPVLQEKKTPTLCSKLRGSLHLFLLNVKSGGLVMILMGGSGEEVVAKGLSVGEISLSPGDIY